MKNNEKKEVNIFQKYDDLFVEQDKKYDKNNKDRYQTNKKVSVPQDDQAFFDKKQTAQKNNNINAVVAVTGFFVMIGFIGFFLYATRLGITIPWFFMFIVVGVVMSVIKKAKKK
ncbi:MAG: hypothetical protein K9L02_01450 [Acholeplasmataceae bacterium]|nr:hypothetical protein [Acholeplasmataceae bacterium]